ncbi:Glycosyltransferase, GT2 family [Ruaniaceae bacterium KH17]|nr:Glycosyltransferase, GT2 family [Ruaniaceae bacterium KH17]
MTAPITDISTHSDTLEISPRPTGYALQHAIWPEPGISTETDPHLEVAGPVSISLSGGGADFGPGGSISTGTYYNLLNLGKWRTNAGDLPLELQLTGQGRFALSIYLASPNKSWHQVFSETIELDGTLRQPIDTSAVTNSAAVLFFSLTALTDGRLDDFAWLTTAPPRTTPTLTLAVTTFRRENEVARTAERFRRFRATSPLREHIQMVIVDNGGTATLEDGDGVAVIPNENLGGSGGFARGLIAARESGATHCLFMDDDASIQMEAITRTWTFLAYAQDPRTAVAGAMINASHRWQIWENGARFDLGCKALYHGLDLRDREQVLRMEFETTSTAPSDTYAGWWFFAFPIAQVKHMPFPFFVRGDDVSFSLVNDFNTVTLPGVASVQENFTDKASPQTWYLDFRSHLAHYLSGVARHHSWRELRPMLMSFYSRNALRFHYDTLAAVNLALEDVMEGPEFFDKNADMAQRRADVKNLTATEAWQPITSPPREDLSDFSRPVRLIWRASVNGHLMPFGKSSRRVVPSIHRDTFPLVYGATEITYLNADGDKAYTVQRDRKRFARETTRFWRNTRRLQRNYVKLQKEWQRGYAEMTSTEYWEAKLNLNR